MDDNPYSYMKTIFMIFLVYWDYCNKVIKYSFLCLCFLCFYLLSVAASKDIRNDLIEKNDFKTDENMLCDGRFAWMCRMFFPNGFFCGFLFFLCVIFAANT